MSDSHGGGGHGPSKGSGDSGASRQAIFFIAIIACAATIAYAGISGFAVNPIFWGAFLLLVAFLLLLSPRMARLMEYERGVFFRVGKFHYVAEPGIHLYFPFIDSFVKLDMRVFRVTVPSAPVITSDNITIKVGVVYLMRVIDPKKAVLNVKDYHTEMTDLSSAELRNAVSKYTLQEVLDNTDFVHDQLVKAITPVASEWGLSLSRLAVETIDIPPEVKDAMDARRQAVERKAKIETDAQARKLVIETVNEAASRLSPLTMEFLYLDTLKRIADGRATKIVLPLDMAKGMSADSLKRALGANLAESLRA